MTDLRSINSQSNKTRNLHGHTIYTVRDSLLSEILLSLIVGLTLLSCVMVIKSYVLLIDVGMYPQFVTLLIPIFHVFIRRLRTDMQFPLVIMQLMVPTAFFFIVINIPVLEFGNSAANKFYLVIILIAYTIFSIYYRLKPSFSASDTHAVAVAGLVHIVLFLLFSLTKLDKASITYRSAERNAEAALLDKNYQSAGQAATKTIIIHAILIVILYIIMRQLAVFDAKYFHSINKSTRSAATLLKKQNNKTVAGLITVISISLLVLAVLPIDTLSRVLMTGAQTILKQLGFLFDDRTPEDIDVGETLQRPEDDTPYSQDAPVWIDIAVKFLAIIIIIGIILFILNTIRLLIQNAPRYAKDKRIASDDNLIDTIEDLAPDKKPFLSKRLDFGKGRERRIRKKFYDKSRHAIKIGLPVSASSTPGQVEKALRAEGEDISALRAEYEKVRYGERP